MTEIGQFMLSQRLAFTDTPLDYWPFYRQKWASMDGGTIMPPSPGARAINAEYELAPDRKELRYNVTIYWHPVMEWLARQLPRMNIYHRSRIAAIGVKALRINEYLKQIHQTEEWRERARRHQLPKAKAEELYMIYIDETLRHMNFNPEQIRRYIRDHERSSLGTAGLPMRTSKPFTWMQAYAMTLEEWKAHYEKTRETYELLKRNMGRWTNLAYNDGLRSRSDELPYNTRIGKVTEVRNMVLERTRIIMFKEPLSTTTVHIHPKQNWYDRVLKQVQEVIDTKTEYYTPAQMGGKMYVKAAELFNNGPRFYAYDGKTWESIIPEILGPAFNPFYQRISNMNRLPSGITPTSMFGTIANIIVNKDNGGQAIVLGDDMNLFNPRRLPQEPFIEYQAEDTEMRFILGLSYRDDATAPRIIGFKGTSDRGASALPLHVVAGEPWSQAVEKARDARHVALYISMFKGRFGDRTLLQAIQTLQPDREIWAPREFLEEMIEEKVSEVDPFAWAEEQGIKRMVALT